MTYLIACGRRKAEGPAKARDLYVGGPTKRILAMAEAKGRTFILSALHGLVDPDATILRAYDCHLDDLTGEQKVAWAMKVKAQMRARGIRLDEVEYVGFSKTYRAAVDYLKETK